MDIEKALKSYLKGTGPKVKEKDFFVYSNGNGDACINVLFKLTDEEINSLTDSKKLDRVVDILKYGEIVLRNEEGLNRKSIARKIFRLQQKIDRVIFERKRRFKNVSKVKTELNKVDKELERLLQINEAKDTRQYDFIEFLIDETKNINYLEYTFKKMPSMANVRSKNEVPIFQHVIDKYLRSIEEKSEEDIPYYDNLISLFLSQKSFHLSDKEKKKCLEKIYRYLNDLSRSKEIEKQRQYKIKRVNNLVEKIKNTSKKQDVEEIASKYNIHVYFSPLYYEALKVMNKPQAGKINDRVLVEDYVVSMDGEETVEIDDALSCKKLGNGNYLLGVHIASVLGYFPYNSEIIQEAVYRNQSIYLPFAYKKDGEDYKSMIPLFPIEFAGDIASLKENENRFTRSYYFEINNKGEVVNEKFLKTITKNNKRLTYNEVNRMLDRGCDDSELGTTIKNLHDVASILSRKYKGNELYEMVKENTRDNAELRVKNVGSESIVYQAMLLTGTRVANFFAENNYPCLYRVHEVNESNDKKLQALIDNLTETYGGDQFKNLYQLIEGIYPKGWYAMEGKHSGLGVDHYCHCTSALRRAADILVEHALEVCYDKKPTKKELEELKKEIINKQKMINERQAPIDYFVKEYSKKYRRR